MKYDPAFPITLPQNPDGIIETYVGLTVRDYFAAKALQGICASGPTKDFTNAMIASEVYDLANAMLAERMKYDHNETP